MTARPRFAILASGTGTTAAHLLDAVDAGQIDADVAVVIGNNSRSGALETARSRGVRTEHLSGKTHPDLDALDAAMLAVLVAEDVDLVVLAGDHVHTAVLADGARTSGATVHEVTAEYDEGPVVAQREVPVLVDDDVASLRARVQVAEKSLLADVVADRLRPA